MRGGLFGFGNKPANTAASTLKAKRNYNMAHSKSRVANILSAPGQVRYTNKERIEETYQKAIAELKAIEKPAETTSAIRMIAGNVEQALKSQEARETGAVVLTIPVGVAQLFLKAMRVFLAALLFIFVDIPSMGSIPTSASVLPNKGFNTTMNLYGKARKFTGANTASRNVMNYK
jgi:hypothetical protein